MPTSWTDIAFYAATSFTINTMTSSGGIPVIHSTIGIPGVGRIITSRLLSLGAIHITRIEINLVIASTGIITTLSGGRSSTWSLRDKATSWIIGVCGSKGNVTWN